MLSPYDNYFFESFPNPERHINRLAVISKIFGGEPAPFSGARVLEIGCSTGLNLIGQAIAYPETSFLGIDLSESQIAHARAQAESLKLCNLQFDVIDFREYQAPQQFDFIICHGLYSWISEELRAPLLAKVSQLLTQEGIGYLSYNTRSAWHHREVIQNIIRRFDRIHQAPHLRIERARKIQEQLQSSILAISGEQPSRARDELRRLSSISDQLLLHEYLAEGFRSYHAAEICQKLNEVGLYYFADARPRRNHYRLFSSLPPSALHALFARNGNAENDDISDQIETKSFRAALFGRKKFSLNFSETTLRGLFMATSLVPVGDIFVMGNEEPAEITDETVREVIRKLHEKWPRAVPINELFPEPISDHVLATLEQLFWNQHIELSCDSYGCAAEVAEKPMANAFARLQASQGALIATLKQEYFLANDFERRILQQLDGSKTLDDLVNDTEAAIASGEIKSQDSFDRQALTEIVRHCLVELKERAMLLDV